MCADVLCWDAHRNRIDVLEEKDCNETAVQKQKWCISVGQQGTHLPILFPFESLLK